MIGGALRVSTPFMFVALGECLTEKSGRVNLGLEGTLVLGAMTGYAISYHTGSPVARRARRRLLPARCSAPCTAMSASCRGSTTSPIGIAMMLFGTGIAFFFGKPYIQPSAPRLGSFSLGAWTGNHADRDARCRSIRCSSSASSSRVVHGAGPSPTPDGA